MRSRLDRFYLSRSLSDLVNSCSVRVLGLSDHDGLELVISRSSVRVLRGLWKFNNSLLGNDDFRIAHAKWLTWYIEQWNGHAALSFWISLKKRIVGNVKSFAAKHAREKRRERELLVKEIIALRRRAEKGAKNPGWES